MQRMVPVLAALAMLAPIGLRAQQIQVSGQNRTLSITASAEAERKPDLATVHIGYQLYGPTSDAVTDAAGKTSKAIAAALTGAGIAADSMESENQSTGPVPEFEARNEPAPDHAQRQFQAQQSWTVHTSATNAAKVLATATAAGANNSGAIDWSISDEDSLVAEAAGKALHRARGVAEQMAAGLNVKLGDLLYASNVAESTRPQPMMRALSMEARSAKVEDKRLSLGPPMVTRSATVSAIFGLQ